MKLKATDQFAPDALDLEALLQMRDGRAWAFVRRRAEHVITTAIEDLIKAKTWDEAVRIQGHVENGRRMLEIPGILITETRIKLAANAKKRTETS